MSVSLEETIAKLGEARKRGILGFCGIKLSHISKLLSELQERRKQPEIIRCGECKFFRANMRPDGYIPKGVFEFECKHWNGSCDPTDFCSRAERRTDDDT